MISGRIQGRQFLAKSDAKDIAIIKLLVEDSRRATSDIARKVRLSRDAVAYRIRRLEKEKIILGYFPIVNLKAFDYQQFHVFFLLNEKAQSEHQQFISFLIHHPNTRSVMSYTDTWDLEWNLVAKDLADFDHITTQLFTKFPHVIVERERLAVIRKYAAVTFPSHRSLHQPKNKSHDRIDAKDLILLAELEKNARKSSYDLSNTLSMSPDAVLYRLRRLTQQGIIQSFTTSVNMSSFNYSWYCYVLSFSKFDERDEAKLASLAAKHPAIVRAAKVYGPWDVMLAIVADNPNNYHSIVKEVKKEFSSIIHKYETWLANEEYCYVPVPKIIFNVMKDRSNM